MFARRMLISISIIFLLVFSLIFFLQSTSSAQAGVNPSEVTYKEDYNGDGDVNVADVIKLLLMTRDDPSDPNVDYNGDGSYAINDAIALMLNIMSGNLTPVNVENEVIQGINMVSIPGGTFQMGTNDSTICINSMPAHNVTVSSFQMSQTEITQAQYKAILGTNPSYFTGNDSLPVERVTWYDAVTFCNKLSEAAGFESCYDLNTYNFDFTKNGFRLPTEAEWEYACRARTTKKFYTGDSESDLGRAGWYGSNSGLKTHVVKGKVSNSYCLYDMHGNVWEWCNDWRTDFYTAESQTDPEGPESGIHRCIRGGSYYNIEICCCSAFRHFDYPRFMSTELGFRVVLREVSP